MRPTGISWVADRVRRAGVQHLFGQEFNTAKFTHWTTQWYPAWQVARIQWETLAGLVAYARDASPFYRSRLDGVAGPASVTTELFARIPTLTRHDVTASVASIQAAAGSARVLRRRSGGSSGRGVRIPLNRAVYCWYIAGTWRGLRWWDADFTDRGALLLGSGSSGVQSLAVRAKDWVMNWLRVPVDGQFNGRAREMLERLEAFGPTFLYGYPSAVHRLAREVVGHGWHPDGHLKVIVLTGEPLYAFQRRAIEETFQCPVAEEYGNGEVGSMAFQCREGNLHVTAENVYLEAVPLDPPADGVGRLLVTQLRNRLFPLVRYEIGDVGALAATNCPCGRGLPVVRVVGRARERLDGPDGTSLARPMMERLLAALPAHLQGGVQLAHTKPGHIVLQVERDPRGQSRLAEAGAVGASVFGAGWHVATVEIARQQRLPSGKLPYFIRMNPHA